GAGHADAPRRLAGIARRLVRLPLGAVLQLAVEVEPRRAGLAVDHPRDVVPLACVARVLPRARAGPDRIVAARRRGEPVLHDELLLVVVAQARVPAFLDQDPEPRVVVRLRPGRDAVRTEPGRERVAVGLHLVERVVVRELHVAAAVELERAALAALGELHLAHGLAGGAGRVVGLLVVEREMEHQVGIPVLETEQAEPEREREFCHAVDPIPGPGVSRGVCRSGSSGAPSRRCRSAARRSPAWTRRGRTSRPGPRRGCRAARPSPSPPAGRSSTGPGAPTGSAFRRSRRTPRAATGLPPRLSAGAGWTARR